MYSASKPQLPEEREDGIVQQPVSQFDHTSAWFSMSNIWRMRAFCLAYPPSREHLAQSVRESSERVLTQAVAEVPWGHNTAIIEKIKDPAQRLWYAAQTIEHGWSRAVLVHQIESNLYERTALSKNKAAMLQTRQETMPDDIVSAEEGIKHPLVLEFLGLRDEYSESNLEEALSLQYPEPSHSAFSTSLSEFRSFSRRLACDVSMAKVTTLPGLRTRRTLDTSGIGTPVLSIRDHPKVTQLISRQNIKLTF